MSIKNYVKRWLNSGNEMEPASSYQYSNKSMGTAILKDETDFSDAPLKLTIHNARGGRVVVAYIYNRRTDTSSTHTYIINENDDFVVELSRIIQMETLVQ